MVYWKLRELSNFPNSPLNNWLNKRPLLGILQNDIVSTLQAMQVLKYWRGKHIVIQPNDTTEWRERLKKFTLRCNPAKITRQLKN